MSEELDKVALDLLKNLGIPPTPTIETENPLYTLYAEEAAVHLCRNEAQHCDDFPPCADHLRLARNAAWTAWYKVVTS